MQNGFQLTFADAFAAFVPASGFAWQSWSTLLGNLEASMFVRRRLIAGDFCDLCFGLIDFMFRSFSELPQEPSSSAADIDPCELMFDCSFHADC